MHTGIIKKLNSKYSELNNTLVTVKKMSNSDACKMFWDQV
jgi:hypothetical protein